MFLTEIKLNGSGELEFAYKAYIITVSKEKGVFQIRFLHKKKQIAAITRRKNKEGKIQFDQKSDFIQDIIKYVLSDPATLENLPALLGEVAGYLETFGIKQLSALERLELNIKQATHLTTQILQETMEISERMNGGIL